MHYEALNTADLAGVPTSCYVEVKAFLAHYALARTYIPVNKPSNNQPVGVFVPANWNYSGSNHGIGTPLWVYPFSNNYKWSSSPREV